MPDFVMKTEAYPHQMDALNFAYGRKYFGLFLPPGLGKTKIVIDLAATYYQEGKIDSVLYIGPNGVQRQTLEEQFPLHSAVPIIPHLFVTGSGKGHARALTKFFKTPREEGLKVFAANVECFSYDTYLALFRMYLQRFKTFTIIDECFAPSTPVGVLTDCGIPTTLSIAKVTVGMKVLNATGVGEVVAVTKKEVRSVVRISFSGTEIFCSENHPFFTVHGWKLAKDLRSSDYLVEATTAMCMVRGDILPENTQGYCSTFLRGELLREVVRELPGSAGEKVHSRKECCVEQSATCLLQNTCGGGAPEKDGGGLEVVKHSRGTGKVPRYTSSDGEHSKSAWRKWTWAYRAATSVIQRVGSWLGNGTRNTYRGSPVYAYLPNLLQSRLGPAGKKTLYRGGRQDSLCQGQETAGHEEGCLSGRVRVERVEVLEPRDTRLDCFRDESGALCFYDLTVSGHPSYSVNGVLVHNCQSISNPSANRTRNLTYGLGDLVLSGKRIVAAKPLSVYRAALTGTPTANSPFSVWSMAEFLQHNLFGLTYSAFCARYGLQRTDYVPNTAKQFRRALSLQEMQRIRQNHEKGIAPVSTCAYFSITNDDYLYVVKHPDIQVPYKNLPELKETMRTFAFTRRKEDCLSLPPKIYTHLTVDMTPEQKEAYTTLAKDLVAEYAGKELSVLNKISLVTRLSQIAGGFFPSNDGEPAQAIGRNPKITALLTDLEDVQDYPVIVLTRFVAEAKAVADALHKKYPELVTELIYGEVDGATRSDIIERFKAGEVAFLVATIRTIGVGFNLQRAALTYYFSNSYSLVDREQSEDRTHRVGQEAESVVYKDILARGTIDERVYEVLYGKKDLAAYMQDMTLEDFIGGKR